MNYSTSVIHGYGIKMSEIIEFIELDSILDYLETHPDDKPLFERFIPENTDITNDEWLEWLTSSSDDEFYEEFAEFFNNASKSRSFEAINDYNGDWFIYIPPCYPWIARPSFSQAYIDKLFTDYIPAFTGLDFSAKDIDYLEIHREE